jgi:hypothetical protein
LAHEIDDRLTASQFRQQLEQYLVGQTAPLRVLTFPDGDAADERDELLSLAAKHWRYAAGILHDGTVAHWLRRSLHDPVAAQAAEDAVRQWPNSPDAALDAFIRQLDPAVLPPAKMELRTTSLRLPKAGEGQRIPQTIEIANQGRGHLRGEILSSQPWVKVDQAFTCPPGKLCDVAVEIDTDGLAAGQPHVAAVTLSPIGGVSEVVPVQVLVTGGGPAPMQVSPTAPAIAVRPDRVDFGTVSPGTFSTSRKRVTVTNTAKTSAQVRVQGAPRWLLVKPEAFHLVAGARQVVKMVGRVGKAPRGRQHRVTLTFALDGGQDQEVEVLLRVKGGGLFG